MRRPVDHRFFTRVLVTLLLIGLLPILVLTTAFYVRSRTQLRSELVAQHERNLNAMTQSVERLIYQISDMAHQVIADAAFTDFEQFPNGDYYERLRGPYPASDLVPLQEYLEVKEACIRRLMRLRGISDAITSVFYYDVARGIVLTDLPFLFSADTFYDMSWKEQFSELEASPLILNTTLRTDREGRERPVITLIHRPLLFQNRNSGLVVNVDADALFSLVTRDSRIGLDEKLFVYSVSGAPIMPTTAPATLESVVPPGVLEQTRTSELLGWRFIARISERELYAPLSSLRLVILITTFLVGAVVVLATVVSSRRLYNPILSLLESVRKSRFYEEPSDNTSSSELETIGAGFRRAVEETKRLGATVAEILPAYRERFLRSLTEGTAGPGSESRPMGAFLDVRLRDEDAVILVVSPTDSQPLSPDPEGRLIGSAAITELIDTVLLQSFFGTQYPADADRFVVLANCDFDSLSRLFARADELLRRLRARFSRRFTVGIGTVCGGYSELFRSYREAVEALEYRAVNGEGVVVYYEEVRVGGSQPPMYPAREDAALRVRLKHGDREGAVSAFHQLLAAVERSEPVIHRLQLEQLFLRLLSNIAETLSSLGISSDVGERGAYYEVIAHGSEHAVIEWLASYVSGVAGAVAEATVEKQNQHVEAIERHIATHFREATLLSVAEELGLSPAHVSRIYKESTGRTFMERLTAVRIEESKRLLRGKATIQQVAEDIGYSNANYFIRLFKRSEGITPGEFRELAGRP